MADEEKITDKNGDLLTRIDNNISSLHTAVGGLKEQGLQSRAQIENLSNFQQKNYIELVEHRKDITAITERLTPVEKHVVEVGPFVTEAKKTYDEVKAKVRSYAIATVSGLIALYLFGQYLGESGREAVRKGKVPWFTTTGETNADR